MSILINGMEMPSEGEYHMTLYVCSDGSAYIDVASFPVDEDRFKAVPVPEHGDLVDRREAIIDANERAYDFWLSDDEVNATIQFLKEQPTIIPAEEGE
jgi:hypothetical protein